MMSLVCTFVNGTKEEHLIPETMLSEWINCYKEGSSFMYNKGNSIVGIGCRDVVTFVLTEGNAQKELVKEEVMLYREEDTMMEEYNKALIASGFSSKGVFDVRKASKQIVASIRHRGEALEHSVLCKCGLEYEFFSSELRYKGVCAACESMVFLDLDSFYSEEEVLGPPYVLTNTKYIDRNRSRDVCINVNKLLKEQAE